TSAVAGGLKDGLRLALTTLALLVAQIATSSVALAADAPSAAAAGGGVRRTYSVPPGPLGDALARFAANAGVSVQIDPKLVEGRATKGLSGAYSVPEGFAALLAGTGLEAMERAAGVYALRTAAVTNVSPAQTSVNPPASSEQQLPEV